jgi:hypothetical protein
MIESIIPSVVGGIFNIFGSRKQKKAQEKSLKAYQDALEKNKDRAEEEYRESRKQFNQDFYGDYMERDAIKNMMNRFRETYERNNRVAQNRSVMSGLGDAQARAAMAQSYENLADTAGSIAAQGDTFRNNALSRYESANKAYTQALSDYNTGIAQLEGKQAEANQNAWADFGSVVNGLASELTSSMLSNNAIKGSDGTGTDKN